ncbi:cytochrome c-type biogenesis protein [Curvivirga aplysinae]|uniref:cytochrome c-type biogenesis protein n=1 Tax=Curvivirga aplysinae TaxID=2529852 RepID=UPI0012BC79CA|nr:cytochrome c-type biogenesis protein [Curvivirga aplysinae]MTI08503.1 cytochrome c-type biogenesis protein CcmH [Curvivirga aplysinae]
MTIRKLILILSLLFLPLSAQAVQPDEILDDPVLEERARVISEDLRCLVCQNQSIDDSDADLARDLRIIVRERLVAGDSNYEVLEFIVARYGNYVLLDPPMNIQTLILWIGPLIIFLLGSLAVVFWYRGRNPVPEIVEEVQKGKLSAAEEKRLKEILGEEGDQ